MVSDRLMDDFGSLFEFFLSLRLRFYHTIYRHIQNHVLISQMVTKGNITQQHTHKQKSTQM